MPDYHTKPVLAVRVPSELQDWARAEAQRQGITLTAILTEALENYRALAEADPRWPVSHPSAELLAEAERTGVPVITLFHQKEHS